MSKKNRQAQQQQQQKQHKPAPVSVEAKGLSSAGKKIILAGFVLLAAGYFVLTKTDPAGQNLASKLSPFMILGGYALIGAGIAVPEKK